jgi:hypothetical protein
MKTFIDTAKQGAESIGAEIRTIPKQDANNHADLLGRLASMKTIKIPVETSDGTRKDIEVIGIPVQGTGLPLLRMLSAVQASGYLRQPTLGTTIHGMLSPNYDHKGEEQQSTIRFQGVNGGFTIENGVWLPEAKNATFLAGATGLEGKGMGGSEAHGLDPEHRLNAYGALSIGNIAQARSHAQHGVRESGGSIAHALSNSKLGTTFAAGGGAEDEAEKFLGFTEAVELKGTEGATFYIPRPYIDSPEESFGAFITTSDLSPQQVLVGSALQVNVTRGNDPLEFIKEMEGSTCTNS